MNRPIPPEVEAYASEHLTAIARLWKNPRVTLLVRSPDMEAEGKDADFIMTNDDLNAVAAMVDRRRNAK